MAYLKPPWFTRAGSSTGSRWHSARWQRDADRDEAWQQAASADSRSVVPEVDGVKYLVSTGGETEWVKNVRADPNVSSAASSSSPRKRPSTAATDNGAYRPKSETNAECALFADLLDVAYDNPAVALPLQCSPRHYTL